MIIRCFKQNEKSWGNDLLQVYESNNVVVVVTKKKQVVCVRVCASNHMRSNHPRWQERGNRRVLGIGETKTTGKVPDIDYINCAVQVYREEFCG